MQNENKPPVYEGTDPYIFVSYAHAVSERALKIIRILSSKGYRIWYDKGLQYGKPYDDLIADKIENCTVFLCLLTDEYGNSKFCKWEFNYAVEKLGILCIPVYMDDILKIKLPGGIQMKLSDIHSVVCGTEESILAALDSSNDANKCLRPVGIQEKEVEAEEELLEDDFVSEDEIRYVLLKDGTAAVFFECDDRCYLPDVYPEEIKGHTVSEYHLTVIAPLDFSCIPDEAFRDCGKLTSVTIEKGITSIGKDAFLWCENVKSITIPEGVTSIADNAFMGCLKLERIILPNSVTFVGKGVFSSCSSLKEIFVSKSHPYLMVSNDSLISKKDNRLISFIPGLNVKEYKTPRKIEIIGERAFENCLDLICIIVSEGVTSIGKEAFWNCENLETISLPDSLINIGDAAFENCHRLRNIRIPNSLTEIGIMAFSKCSSLTSIIIPESVTSVGKKAFFGCDSLTLSVSPNSFGEKYCKENELKFLKLHTVVGSAGEPVLAAYQSSECTQVCVDMDSCESTADITEEDFFLQTSYLNEVGDGKSYLALCVEKNYPADYQEFIRLCKETSDVAVTSTGGLVVWGLLSALSIIWGISFLWIPGAHHIRQALIFLFILVIILTIRLKPRIEILIVELFFSLLISLPFLLFHVVDKFHLLLGSVPLIFGILSGLSVSGLIDDNRKIEKKDLFYETHIKKYEELIRNEIDQRYVNLTPEIRIELWSVRRYVEYNHPWNK